jgi:hypothetical protein
MFNINHCSYESINDDQDCGEEYLYDTFDQIIDTNRGDQEMDIFDDIMGPEEMGLAFALAEEMRDAEYETEEEDFNRVFDVDEHTDEDNLKKAMETSSLQARHGTKNKLRPFEQYVDDICKGRRPLFED